ncbi:MAG: PepSY-like domain-containing protein [Saprospiraceae bacterium]
MKKIILFASTAVLFLFTACQKDTLSADLNTADNTLALNTTITTDDNLTDEAMIELVGSESVLKRKKVKIEDLLPAILTYINANYAGAKLIDAYTDETGNFSVILKDAEGKTKVVIFDKNGTFLKEGNLPDKGLGKGDSIVKKIRTYINANYPGTGIGHIQRNKDGSFNVAVKSKDGKVVILNFDKNGNFVKVVSTNGGGTGGGLDSTVVSNIKRYLNFAYPGSSFGNIEKGKDGGYSVVVKSKDGKVTIVYFDKDGKFVKAVGPTIGTGTGSNLDSIAVFNIKQYLTKAYPDATIGAIEKGKDGGYSVVVKSKDGKVTTVYFDKNGKFVKAVGPTIGTGTGSNLDSIAVFNIKQYLTKAYPDANIGTIEKGKDGGYSVVVKSKDGKVTTVYFDKNGKFIKAVPQTTGGGGTSTLDPKVATAIKGYLTENYAGASFSEINRTNDGYFVKVKTADGKLFTVYFNKDGKFVKVTP